jgi:hypothetical protein
MSVSLKRAMVAIAGMVMSTLAVTLACAASDSIAKRPSESTGLRVAFVRLEEHAPTFYDGSSEILYSLLPGVIYHKTWELNLGSGIHSKCLKERLDHSGVFALVNEEQWNTIQNETGMYDFLVTGALEYDTEERYRLTYGLSILIPFLALLGAPDEWRERHMLMDISIRRPSDPYHVLYQKKIEIHGPKKFSNTFWYESSSEERFGCSQEENVAVDEILNGVRPGGPIIQSLVMRKAKEITK